MIDRQTFIGGSDVGAIFGVHPYKTAYDLWLEKSQGVTTDNGRNNEKFLTRGKKLEPYVLEMLVDETQITVSARNIRYFLEPWQSCEVDFEWMDEHGKRQNGEIKTVNTFMAKFFGEEYSDQVPNYYVLQALHALMITEREKCLLAALVGNDDLRIYYIHRDEEAISTIQEAEESFWSSVMNGQPPEPQTVDDLGKMFKANGGEIIATAGIIEMVNELKAVKKTIKDAEHYKNDLEFSIKSFMQDHSVLTDAQGKKLITWAEQKSMRLNQSKLKTINPELYTQYQEESISRVFRTY